MPTNWPPLLSNPAVLWLLLLDLIWEGVWKGIALWKAGRDGHKGWFVAIFILNTLGILPIVYIYSFNKERKT